MTTISKDNINITGINAFSDNYIWSIQSSTSNKIALVDPGDATVCLAYIEQNKLILTAILITHHHRDHVGGIETLVNYCKAQQWPLTVYGPANENIPHWDVKLIENDRVELTELGATFNVLDIPGHTAGHIAYVNDDFLFCGDTLFSAGCGRLFEGTPQQMHNSLNKLTALPSHTKVYCAHEYTAANLNFALTVDPENFELIHYFNQVNTLRAQNKPTIPTTIALEKQINPFLRCNTPAIQQSATDYNNKATVDEVDTLAVIRQWKDNF